MVGKYAFLVNASMPEFSGDDFEVTKPARAILAANLLTLKEGSRPPFSQGQIGSAIGVNQTTIGRILNQKHKTGVDSLDGLGKLFRLHPWQLLVPELDPSRPPEVMHLSPKAVEVARLYDALSPHKQRLLFAQAQVMHNPDIDPEAPTPPALPT